MQEETCLAPFNKILPSFAPVLFERGVADYLKADLVVIDERRLTESEARCLIIACAYIGTHSLAVEQGFDYNRVMAELSLSINTINDLKPEEKEQSLKLVREFYGYKFIRFEHNFNDWVCEALWKSFQNIQYEYPSTMAGLVADGLNIMVPLKKFKMAYSE